MENLGASEEEAQDFGFLLFRKEVTLPDIESVLTVATKVRDMLTVMVDGVHQIRPLQGLDDLVGPGFWLNE
jgi:hypothetical protein